MRDSIAAGDLATLAERVSDAAVEAGEEKRTYPGSGGRQEIAFFDFVRIFSDVF